MVKVSFHRLLRHPRPWLLLYLLVSVPSPILALLIAGVSVPFARYPLLREVIGHHSLDAFIEMLLLLPKVSLPGLREGSIATLIGLCGLLLVLPLWPLLRLWLEGGILYSYLREEAVPARHFWSACRYHFPLFARLFVVELLGGIVVAIPFILAGYLALRLGPAIGRLARWVGLLSLLLFSLWFELARTAAVIEGERRLLAALKAAAGFLRRRGPRFLLVLLGWGVGFALLSLFWKGVTHLIPLTAWPFLLILGQLHLLLRLLLYLWRRVMEILLWPSGEVEEA